MAYNGSVKVGKVGIGIFAPADNLHVHQDTAAANYILLTNSTTGSSTSDGLRIGVTATGAGEINLKENANLILYSNNTIALQLSPTVATMGRILNTTGVRLSAVSLSSASTLSESIDIAYAALASRGAPSFTTTLPTSPTDGQMYILRRIDNDATQTWTISAGGTIVIYMNGSNLGVTTITVGVLSTIRLVYHSSFTAGWYQV
jgi:hypothetical protein